MPYYKNSSVVSRSIDSVLSQSVSDFELLIVDDGSNDCIQSIVDDYNDPRIILIKKNNEGVSKTRNTGIKKASGEWICFLDSDDAWTSNHLAKLSELIQKYNTVKMFCTSHKRLGNITYISSASLPFWFPDDFVTCNLIDLALCYGDIIHTNSFCIHRSLFDLLGLFSEDASIGEDTDLWYRFSVFSKVVLSKEVTSIYYRDASTLTKKTNNNRYWPFLFRSELVDDYKIPIEIRESVRRIWIRTQLSICKHLLAEGEKTEAKKLFVSIDKNDFYKKSRFQVKLLLILPIFISKFICQIVYAYQMKHY